MLHNLYKCGHTIIINNYWMRLSKISRFVSGEQIIMCWSRRLRQIIDVRDTGKWRYFAITEFNNCFIIRSPSLFFNDHLREVKRSAFFHARTLARRRKAWCCLCISRMLFAAKHSWTTLRIAHEQTIICSQLFAGHVVGFRPMKRKKNLHRMIIDIIVNDSVKKNTCKKILVDVC